ncbi:hypothetical protein BGZ99_009169 [Dissophora globulifera]|uniref:Uncharacterized protein n=1 Tax=Dissophora globulifera TaxID=979702 RepID=A0A9P6UNS0_9FUNG|nr:hypothetical protein BGZ99_009169 [Dissophora globulifera]
MSRKQDRGAKAAPKVLDSEARRRQLRHHLDSLERDNFVALNEYEAIIATAAAAAAAQGPISLTHTNLDPLGILPPLSPAVGSIVGGIVGTVGPGALAEAGPKSTGSANRSKKHNNTSSHSNSFAGSSFNGGNSGDINGMSSTSSTHGHRRPALPRKPLTQLLEESGLMSSSYANTVSYVTAAMGPSRHPDRQFSTNSSSPRRERLLLNFEIFKANAADAFWTKRYTAVQTAVITKKPAVDSMQAGRQQSTYEYQQHIAREEPMESTQSFRLAGATKIQNIPIQYVDGQSVIYWESVEKAFPGAKNIRNGNFV